ncbi:hypothetical protein PTE31013_04115 [Pandoraea terrigena]|uniref:Uncharacterized protein n=1 Tax=Pandoraea terrigena TaxID=2508292 RepID=A0A5E4XTD2_9BURK|nr:hypothetical protein PTE31013_04115 [Pandoraea terrigena]
MSPSTGILPLRRTVGQRSHAHQAVRCMHKRKQRFDPLTASIYRLPSATGHFAPSKRLFEPSAFRSPYLVAEPACRPAIDGRAALTRAVLRHRRSSTVGATACYEARRVIVLVSADPDGRRRHVGGIGKHFGRRITLSDPVRQRGRCVDHQAVPVIVQSMAHIAKHGADRFTLAKQTRRVIDRRCMRGVAAFPVAAVVAGRESHVPARRPERRSALGG